MWTLGFRSPLLFIYFSIQNWFHALCTWSLSLCVVIGTLIKPYKVSDLPTINSGVGFWRKLEYQWKLDSRSTTPSSFDIEATLERTSWFNTFASTSTRSNKEFEFMLHRCGTQEWHLIIPQLHLAGAELGKVSWDEPVLITRFVDSPLANVYKPT